MKTRIRSRGGAPAGALVPLLASVLAWPSAAGAAALAPGAEGAAVEALQRAFGVESDVVFGEPLRVGVVRLQRVHGPPADGEVGPATWGLLLLIHARARRRARAHDGAVVAAELASRRAHEAWPAPARRTLRDLVRAREARPVPALWTGARRTLSDLVRARGARPVPALWTGARRTLSDLVRARGARPVPALRTGARRTLRDLVRAREARPAPARRTRAGRTLRDLVRAREARPAPALWALRDPVRANVAERIRRTPAHAVEGPVLRIGVRVQRPHMRPALPRSVRRVIAAGDRIATMPYHYGGGHGNWNDSGYDCSGSVSYALHGGGLLDVPLASGGLMSWGEPGPGRWISVYANAGHAFMVVNGRRFDTSGRDGTGSRWQTAMRGEAGYVVRHPAGL